jgi:hypothetical protein
MIIKMDRRTFLEGAGLVVATTLVPLSVVHAVTTEGLWHVDDVCGHWPPYSHPIGYRHSVAPEVLAQIEPIDHIYLA